MPIDGSEDLLDQEYVDDTLLFCDFAPDALDSPRIGISTFCCASGARINWHKSSSFVVAKDEQHCSWGEDLGFTWIPHGKTCKYLGFHVVWELPPNFSHCLSCLGTLNHHLASK